MESLRCPSPFLWVFSSPKGYSLKWITQCCTEVKRLNHKSGGEHLCHFCSYGRPHSSMERGLAVGELGQIEEIAAWTWTWRWETYLEARIKWRKKKWIAGGQDHEPSQRAWMSFIQQGPLKQWQPHQLLLQYSWQPGWWGGELKHVFPDVYNGSIIPR